MSAVPRDDSAIAAGWREIAQRLGPMVDVLNELRLGVSADDACRVLRLPSRVALNRELEARELPPFRLLKNWYQVWRIVHLAETEGGSLCALALHGGEYPAAWYRMAKSTTGHSWREIRERGSAWVMRCALQAWEPYTRMRV